MRKPSLFDEFPRRISEEDRSVTEASNDQDDVRRSDNDVPKRMHERFDLDQGIGVAEH